MEGFDPKQLLSISTLKCEEGSHLSDIESYLIFCKYEMLITQSGGGPLYSSM